ncbi:MAG: toll/interleukin-1 receptor domain-containing protein, partial [Chloroflexota bacterium]
MSHIFVSYASKDSEFVNHLVALLKEAGFTVWQDQEQLDVGDVWSDKLENAITNCKAFIIVMSNHSKQSIWVKRELGLAEKLNKPILPIHYTGEIWWNLSQIQVEDMQTGLNAKLSPRFIKQLAIIVGKTPPSNAKTQTSEHISADSKDTKIPSYKKPEIVIGLISLAITLLALLFGDDLYGRFLSNNSTATPEATSVMTEDPTTPDTDGIIINTPDTIETMTPTSSTVTTVTPSTED